MNLVNGLTDQPVQVVALQIADGSRATLTLSFRPQQNGWFFDLDWPGSPLIITPFLSNNRRVVTSGNMVRQFRELITFGLAVFTTDNSDPMSPTCWSDGTASLVLLNADDVARVEAEVYASP